MVRCWSALKWSFITSHHNIDTWSNMQSDSPPTEHLHAGEGLAPVPVTVEKEGYQNSRRSGRFDKNVVRNIRDAVKKHIWNDMKFVIEEDDLEFGGDYCAKILHFLDMDRHCQQVREAFWEEHKKVIPKVMRTIRNGAVQAIKESLRHLWELKGMNSGMLLSDW